MDKNNSSLEKKEELFYLKPPSHSFRPELRTPEEIQNENQGYFWTNVWPALKENPVVPFGLTMTVGSLAYGLYCMGTGQKKKSMLMMNYRVGFQFLTVVALMGGFYYRDFKRKMMEKYDVEE